MDRSRFDAGHRSAGAPKLSRNNSALQPSPHRRQEPSPRKRATPCWQPWASPRSAVFLLLTMTKRVSVLVALVLLPVLAALVGGFGGRAGRVDPRRAGQGRPHRHHDRLRGPVLQPDGGRRALRPADPRHPARGAGRPAADHASARPSSRMCVALDGDGASTFLITVSALLPVYKRLGMSPLVLSGVVCLGAGVMNMVPWGGPTVRAMAALKLDSSEVFTPVLPAMGFGIVWVLVASYLIGRRERNAASLRGSGRGRDADAADGRARRPDRASHRDAPATADRDRRPRALPGTGPAPPCTRRCRGTWLTVFNLVLTIALAGLPDPGSDAAAGAVRARVRHRAAGQPPHVGAAAGAARQARQERRPGHHDDLRGRRAHRDPHRHQDDRRDGRARSSPSSPTPSAATCPSLVAVTGMPLSLVFTPDAYYFGVLPVLAETAHGFGTRPGRGRQGRHPRPDDHRLPAQPAHRRPRSSSSA